MKKRDKKNRPKIGIETGALIALTGRIGSGKSFIMSEIAKLGYLTFNADLEAKKILQESEEIKNFLSNQYSSCINDGKINFEALGNLAFKNTKLLKELNKTSHEKIRLKQQDFIKENHPKSILFEIPLLFENHREDYYDYIILAHADDIITSERVLKRKNMTEEKLYDILSKQNKITACDSRVDFEIDTSGGKSKTIAQLEKIFL